MAEFTPIILPKKKTTAPIAIPKVQEFTPYVPSSAPLKSKVVTKPTVEPPQNTSVLRQTVKSLPSSIAENLPFGVGDIVKSARQDPESVYNLSFTDVLQGITDTAKGVFRGLVTSGANLIPKQLKFDVPFLGEVTNREFSAAQKIRNGQDPLTATLEEGTGAIFDTLMLVGLISEVVSPRPTTVLKTTETNVPEGVVTKQPVSFRLYDEPIATQPLTPDTIKTMVEKAGGDPNTIVYKPNYDPSLPTYFKITGKANGDITGEVVQIKRSYLDTFINKFKGDTTNVPPNETVPVIVKSIPGKELENIKPTSKILPTSSPDGAIQVNPVPVQTVQFETPKSIAVQKATVPKEIQASKNETVTDPHQVQEIKNSIQEGQNILVKGTDTLGKKLTPEQRVSIQRSIDNGIAKISEKPKTTTPEKLDYHIKAYDNKGTPAFTPVQGKQVEISPDIHTFIHKNSLGNGEWTVTEARSGLSVASGSTQKEAIQNATTILAKQKEKGVSIKQFIENIVKDNGLSPAFKQENVTKKPVSNEIVKSKKASDEFKVGDILDPQGNTNMEGTVKIIEIKGNTLKFVDSKGVEYSGMKRSLVRDFVNGGSWKKVEAPKKSVSKEIVKPKNQDKEVYKAVMKDIQKKYPNIKINGKSPYSPEKSDSSITLNAELIPGLSKTISEDVLPKAKGILNTTKAVYKEIATAFNPVGQAPREGVDIIMKAKGAFEQQTFRTEQVAKEVKKMWDKQPEEARLNFMAKVESGDKTFADVRGFADLAEMYRDRLDNAYKAIQQYKEIPFIENFFPHFWEKPDVISKDFLPKVFAKRPLSGSKSFLKQRVFETIQEGIKAGYKPVTTNPEELMQIYETNVRKFVMAQTIKEDMIAQKLWKFVRQGTTAPADFARIDDAIARIYYKPEAINAVVPAGEYYAQKDVARLINNYLSKDRLMDTALGKGVMNIKNTLNAFQLGFSAFHLTMETLDTVTTKVSIGLSEIASGKVFKGLGDIVKAPLAPINFFRAGQKFYNGDTALSNIEDSIFQGGASLRERQYYKNTVLDTFVKNIRGGNYLGALFRLPLASIEATMRPLFSYYIPRLKVGAFRELYASELERLSQDIQDKKTTQLEVARNTWNNIENRMGELNYDNLFWNRNLKTALMLTFRAVGWNLGTVRELGGAMFQDIPKEVSKLFTGKGKDFNFTPKMSYTLSLFMLMGTIGAIYQYLHTGKKPEGVKDLYYPKNGAKDKSGEDYRVEFPSYLKDLYQVTHRPVQTVGNKFAPELTVILNLLQNKDYYGDYVRNTNDNLSTQAKQVALFLVDQLTPFTVQNLQQLNAGQADTEQKLEAFFGIIKAPKEVIQNDYQKKLYELYQDQVGGHGALTPEQKHIQELKTQAREQIKKGDYTILDEMIKQGILTERGRKTFIKNALLTSDQRLYNSLSKPSKATLDNSNKDIVDNPKLFPDITSKNIQDVKNEVYKKYPFSDAARMYIDQAKLGVLRNDQTNSAVIGGVQEGEQTPKGADFHNFVVKYIAPFSQKASDFILDKTKFLQNLDKANINIKTSDPEVLAHEMLHQVFSNSYMAEQNPDLSRNDLAGEIGTKFLDTWDKTASDDTDSPLAQIDAHIEKNYNTSDMSGSELATERFAYLGELVARYGLSVIPKPLKHYYEIAFNFPKN